MWQLARTRPRLVLAFVLALALALFFGGRIAVRAIYWANPAHHNQAIEGWMTAGYIGRSWGVDPAALDALAGLPLPSVKGHPQPLVEIAADRGVPVAEVIAEVEAALKVLQAAQKGARTGAKTP
jgi:hypothetical protein